MRPRTPVKLMLALLIIAAPALRFVPIYSAPGLLNRSLQVGTTEVSASTTYGFQFDITSASSLGSIRFQFCSNDPIPFNPCTAPTGFDISGATVGAQTGETGFTIDPVITPNELILTRVPTLATPQTVTYDFNNVINPDTAASYFVRLITYASADGSDPSTEEAGIAFAMTDRFDVTAFVPPFLSFCVGLSVAADCSSATGNLIDLGILDESLSSTATSQFAGATNGVGGLAISVIGTTMTSGVNTITGLGTRSPSSVGSSQFGFNLRNNSSPNVGINPAGPGTTVPTGDYNVINEFTFRNGDIIASSPLPTNYTVLTVSYLVNISPSQNPGVYTATLTYIGTATF
ncbi:MAG TPA: hypothetical protein VGA08_02095 [Candidatus Saccharimonadales bacterium]